MNRWVKVAVSVGILALLALVLPWAEAGRALRGLAPAVWLGVLGGFLAGHLLGVVKWRMMLAACRAVVQGVDAIRCYAAGLFANLCLPTIVGGDVLRAALAGRASRRMEAAVLGGVADRAIDLGAVWLLLAGGTLTARTLLPAWGLRLLVGAAILGAAGLTALVVLAWRVPVRRWHRRIRRPAVRAVVALRRLATRPGRIALALLLALLIQGGFVLLNAWVGRAIGIAVPLGAWFVAWPLAKLAGMMPVSLGGLGVRDVTLGAILVPLGVPLTQGVVASLIWQSVLIAGGLLAGGAWWLLGRTRSVGGPRVLGVPAAASRGRYG